jgi:DNA-binding transcriptional LysR family regulator
MASKNIRNIDFNLLIVFDVVYATANISHAAKQLALTQPAVSNAIARLREHFGDPLFVREGRGMKPTVRAQQMIAPIRDALRIIRQQIEGDAEIDLPTYKRTFRLVTVDTLEPLLMPPLLRDITERAPHICIESRPPSHTHVVNQLNEGTLDLACYTFISSMPGIVVVPIFPCDYIVVARRGHPKIGKTLDKETFMSLGQIALVHELRGHANIDRDISTRGGTRRIVYMVHKVWSVPAMVGSTDLVSVLPRRFAEQVAPAFDLVIHETPVPIADQDYHMMWHERHNDDAGHKWLRDTIMGTISGLTDAGRSFNLGRN